MSIELVRISIGARQLDRATAGLGELLLVVHPTLDMSRYRAREFATRLSLRPQLPSGTEHRKVVIVGVNGLSVDRAKLWRNLLEEL
jgi:hypothetical protein